MFVKTGEPHSVPRVWQAETFFPPPCSWELGCKRYMAVIVIFVHERTVAEPVGIESYFTLTSSEVLGCSSIFVSKSILLVL